ncbi:asparagine synthase (glutamine-hydrolyzing) [Salinispirillum marinum]|uniref:asparagine synthase (glutamine-hydrolyzing) n=2 Tax=Saccharospirillaceae TaxID=255527 RepID=A0ABV8BDS4_9GAMM
MCGIGGYLRNPDERPQYTEQRLAAMGQALYHRGPDAGAQWQDDRIGLVHRRLAIIDLSDAGIQPMHSACERYVMVFNGEIYNFKTLRAELKAEGVLFRTHTDSEVILMLYERLGTACLQRLNGMFAVAIWDRQAHTLFLARDRLGKKPLYVYEHGGQVAFASEIKALLRLPFVRRDLRPDAIQDFFFHQYVPDPKTIFAHIHKLPPAHFLLLGPNGHRQQEEYWHLSFADTLTASPEQIAGELHELIDDSVQLRQLSDVPLGAFLSGGIDSSAVVGLMAGNSDVPVTTCSIGFDDDKFDEITYARQVATQFNTDHHEFTVRQTVQDHLVEIARYFDEPFADPSFVPTYFVSQLARQRVTVALAGDGGDENFAGYSKYRVDEIENTLRGYVPGGLRRNLFPPMAGLLGALPGSVARRGRSLLSTLAQEPDRSFFITNAFFTEALWQDAVQPDFQRQLNGYDPAEVTLQHYRAADAPDHLGRVLYTDIKTYLPGDILVKVDRMSMANSLETRAPLLDYRVVEYAARIPSALKLHQGEKKHILKQAMTPLLSNDILYRRKMGFSVPLAQWLRHEIRALAERTLLQANAGLNDFFKPSVIARLWHEHQAGKADHAQALWSFLVFELWWQQYVVGLTGEEQVA